MGKPEKVTSLKRHLSPEEWWVRESSFDLSKTNFYETIFTIGNGYLGTRGAYEEGNRASFPGTYINGLFDHYDSTVVDLVNAPDWLPVNIWVEGELLSLENCEVLDHERVLDLKLGLLFRSTRYKDRNGRITRYESLRFANFADQHVCEMRVEMTPENYSGKILLEGGVNGNTFNLDRMPQYTEKPAFDPQVKWEKWAKSKHLYDYKPDAFDQGVYLECRTRDRDHAIGYASAFVIDDIPKRPKNGHDQTSEHLHAKVEEGKTLSFQKLVTIYTSRDGVDDIQKSCVKTLNKQLEAGPDERLAAHSGVWNEKWEDCDVVIEGDEKACHAVRFNIYHLLICANSNDPFANIGAKSLSGEGYKGHVFWDTEIFMLPFFIYTQPETAKALLRYRYNMLGGAKKNAEQSGFTGARYPWESADTGLEETPKWTHDGKERIWTGEEEIHITSDVVFGLMTYHTATDDMDFFLEYSAEILLETARFWASRLEYDSDKDRYNLSSVIGPDEFHEHVDNSVFTNWLARWNLEQSVACYHLLASEYDTNLKELESKIGLKASEVEDWKMKAEKVFIPFDPEKKLVEQFEGYFGRRDVPIVEWDENDMPVYPENLDHFSCNDTTLLKQPDVVMLMYILPDEFSDEIKKLNYEYYEARTMHKSSLSPSIHTIMGIETGNSEKALQYFQRSAFVDLVNNQGNTDDGIHVASAGGTWQSVVNGFGGLRVKNKKIHFKPWLPDHWQQVAFKIKWKGNDLGVKVGKSEITLQLEGEDPKPEEVYIDSEKVFLEPHKSCTFAY